MGCLPPDIRQQGGSIGSSIKAAIQGGPGCLIFLQPLFRVGVALELFVDLQDQGLQSPVIPPGTQCVRQCCAPFVQGIIKGLQRPFQHPLAHQRRIALIQDPEIRCQRVLLVIFGQQVCVLPQQRGAEGVHRFDIRPVDPQ